MNAPKPSPHNWATVGCGACGEYEWFDPERRVERGPGEYLHHWRQPGAVYFLTVRTADSIPAAVLDQWSNDRTRWLERHPEPHDEHTRREFHQRFTERMHRYLDDCHGECPFRNPDARAALETTLQNRDGTEYALDWYVIMPNHAHVLVSPHEGHDLSEVDKTWKSVSAHHVNKLLGRRGTLWQRESWDHLVRSPEHLESFRRYVVENPSRLPRS